MERSTPVRKPHTSTSDLLPWSETPPPHDSVAPSSASSRSQVLLGDVGAGKSSLVLRFVKGQFVEFQESTIGAAFFSQTLAVNDATVKFEIWDTAGQERYHSLAPMYYRGVTLAIIVHDMTNLHSSASVFKRCSCFDNGGAYRWINLNAIKRLVDTDVLKWEVDAGSSLIQETTTGSIIRIQFFEHPIGIFVPSSCYFRPNATSGLLLLQLDLYTASNGVLIRNAVRTNPKDPSIELGPEFDKLESFVSRFESILSVVELDSLKVTDDVWFGNDIKLKKNSFEQFCISYANERLQQHFNWHLLKLEQEVSISHGSCL